MTAIALHGFNWRSLLHRAAQRQRALMALQSPLAGAMASGPLATGKAIVAVGPTTLILDQFTDANGTLLTAHTIAPTNVPATSWQLLDDQGTGAIQSNAYQYTNVSSGSRTEIVNAGVADYVLTYDFNYIKNVNYGCAVVYRITDLNNYWLARLLNGSLQIYERTSASTVLRASQAYNPPNGNYTARLTLSGNSMTYAIDGGSSVSYSSSVRATVTNCGFRLLNTGIGTMIIDNFMVVSA